MDKNEIKKYLIMLKETANDIADLSSYLNQVSDKEITNTIIPSLSDSIKKNIEYFSQYIYDIKAYNFTIDDIDILDLLINKERAYFALYPTLINVKLHDKEWNKYSVLCGKIQETIYLIVKQYNKRLAESGLLKDDNSKHKEVIPNQKEEVKKDTSFRSLIQYEDKDKLLERLHFLIDPNPKKGSLIAAIIQKAYIDGHILELPNEATFRSEFKLDCTWEAVRKSFISTPYIKTSSSYIKMMQIKILD